MAAALPRRSAMSRDLLVLWAGRHRRRRWEEAVEEYRRKLRRMYRVTDRQVRGRRAGDDVEARRREGEAILSAVPEGAWVIALDASGRMSSSEAFAERLAWLRDNWTSELVFVLGSDLGLDPKVLGRADEVLSLGPMTLPHELARVVLYEQLYRAWAIRSGIKYHR